MSSTRGPESTADWLDAPRQPGWHGRLPWVPIPLALASILGLWVADLRTPYESTFLLLGLNVAFIMLVSLGIAILVGRSFLARGLPGLLLLGCGALTWSTIGVVSTLASILKGAPGVPDVNTSVTIYNTCAWISASLHLAGVTLSLRSADVLKRRRLWLTLAYLAVLAVIALVTLATLQQWLPVFFVPGKGTTGARQFVLGSAIAMFALTAALLHGGHLRSSSFRAWYGLAMFLLATGLLGVMLQPGWGTALGWAGRATQYFGGIYMFIAAVVALRESGLQGITAGRRLRVVQQRYVMTVVIVAAAVVVREAFLPDLGARFVFITLYPAVMLSALYGGWRAGAVATLKSVLIADLLWIEPTWSLSFDESADAWGTMVFFGSGLFSSWIAEAMLRAKLRAEKAESQVAAQRDRLKMIIESLPQFIWTSDRAGDCDYSSPQMSQYTGASASEIAGAGWLHFIHPDEQEKFGEQWQNVVREGQDFDGECRMRRFDGAYRWFKVLAIPQRDARNRVIRWYGSCIDVDDLRRAEQELTIHRDHLEFLVQIRTTDLQREVAERKRVEENLRRREQEFRTLAEGVPAVIARFDREHRYLFVNRAVTGATGFPPEAFTGKTSEEVGLPAEQCTVYAEFLQQVFANGKSEKGEFELAVSGAVRHFAVEAVPEFTLGNAEFPPGKEVESVILIVSDITERKRAEEALRRSEATLAEAQRIANIGSWEWDMTTGRVFWSQQMYPIFGQDPQKYMPTFGSVMAHIHPEDQKEMQALIQDALDHRRKYAVDSRIVTGRGETRIIRAEGEVMPVAGHKTGRVVGVVMDITARKADELALQKAMNDAKRANEAKSRFLAAASHDLRQPLSALSLYIDLFKKTLSAGDQVLLENMKNCVGSLNELLTNLLDLSKLDAGVVTPSASDFSAIDALANVVSLHSPEAKQKGLRLCCHPSDLVIHSDPVLYARIVGNLVSNAIRYTERGGVLIGCRRHGGKYWIEVWDTGVGIPTDKTAEIFEEFKQLDDARHRGSGLGLAIVAKTAAVLGLEVRVKSRLGRGSMFAVEMPLGSEVTPGHAPAHVYRALRVALVEDNPEIRQVLGYMLECVGHQPVVAASGDEILERLGSKAPDVAISDHRLLGGETGFDVITRLRQTFGAGLPAIIITGDTDPELIRSMVNRGVVVHHKPVEFDVLQASMAELTRNV
ncbi:MAG: PAS domain-containing protein [Betaproteobacteria bacterium]